MAKKIIKLPSLSAVDFDVGKKFFLFTFVIVFLGNTVFNAASSGGGKSAGGSSNPDGPTGIAVLDTLVVRACAFHVFSSRVVPVLLRAVHDACVLTPRASCKL